MTGTSTTYTGPYVFVAQNTLVFGGRTNGSLLKFRADSSGPASPVSTATSTGNGGFHGLVADSAGNIYSGLIGTNSFPYLARYSSSATGETAGQTVSVLGSSLVPQNIVAGPSGDLLLTELDSVPVLRYTLSATGITLAQSLPTQVGGAKTTTLLQIFSVAQDAAGSLFVGDTLGIKVFGSTATGDVAPTRTIAGSNTTLNPGGVTSPTFYALPYSMTVNAAGELYVGTSYCNVDNTAHKTTCTGAILVFAAGASGNVAPVRTLTGDLTGLNAPTELLFDKTGNLYVLDVIPSTSTVPTPKISRFAATAAGNTAPLNSFTSTAWTDGTVRNFAIVN